MGLNTIPGVSIFCGFSTVFRGKKIFSFCTMSGNVVVSRHWRIFSAHPIVCVQSVFSFFAPGALYSGPIPPAVSRGFCKCRFHIGSFCGLHKRVARPACGLMKPWLFFQGIRRPEPCFFVFFRRKSLAYFLPRVLSYSWMRNRCKFFRSGRHLPRKTVSVYEHNQYLGDAS